MCKKFPLISQQSPKQIRARVKICRHCGWRKRMHRRGLCRVCFDEPGVKERYKTIGPRGRRFKHPDTEDFPPRPLHATTLKPGSPEKVEKLRKRANARCRISLHNRFDEWADLTPEAEKRIRELLARRWEEMRAEAEVARTAAVLEHSP